MTRHCPNRMHSDVPRPLSLVPPLLYALWNRIKYHFLPEASIVLGKRFPVLDKCFSLPMRYLFCCPHCSASKANTRKTNSEMLRSLDAHGQQGLVCVFQHLRCGTWRSRPAARFSVHIYQLPVGAVPHTSSIRSPNESWLFIPSVPQFANLQMHQAEYLHSGVFGDEGLISVCSVWQEHLQKEVWHHSSGHCLTFPPTGTLSGVPHSAE